SRLAVADERADGERLDALDPLHRRVEPAQVERLPEGEVGGVEEAARPVREQAIGERVPYRLDDIGAEVAVLRADLDLERHRHEAGRAQLDVVTGEAEARQKGAYAGLEPGFQARPSVRQIDEVGAVLRVDRDEYRRPAPGPPVARDGALHTREASR